MNEGRKPTVQYPSTSRGMMKRSVVLFAFVSMALSVLTYAQPSRPEPVFNVELLTDREPVVAGEQLRLAVVLNIDRGWHVNSDDPGDEFSLPTTVTWTLPEGWPEPEMQFPHSRYGRDGS
jgi:DsbC/DsbD-like thiol-disulfide interchange protein